MALTRTQVYLTDEQRAAIDRRARRQGVTIAQIIRDALDRFLSNDAEDDIDATFGAAPELGHRVPSRSEWERRG